jgi:hypothetical protein
MYRRKRRHREIEFSFDSFLDVVANVCGIIIRLILVTWVGARAYHAATAEKAVAQPAKTVAESSQTESLPAIDDPLERDVQRHREELAKQQERILEQLRKFDWLESGSKEVDKELEVLSAAQLEADRQKEILEKAANQKAGEAQAARVSLADLQRRSKQLADELSALEKQPPPSKILHYRTPLSRPIHTEELQFECTGGRISFIEVEAFIMEVKRSMEDRSQLLKTQSQIDGVTGSVGAFRMHYKIERTAESLDGMVGLPNSGGYRYGMTEWVVEPVTRLRGETVSAALTAGSEFRRQIEALDPERSVVTLWVYPDSFALYRQLRDYLHEKGIEVAGRPLLPGATIAASTKHGTASRGQ